MFIFLMFILLAIVAAKATFFFRSSFIFDRIADRTILPVQAAESPRSSTPKRPAPSTDVVEHTDIMDRRALNRCRVRFVR